MEKRTLTVKTYEDFLENLPTSGLFEMTDCAVEIWCPEMAQVEEIQKMVLEMPKLKPFIEGKTLKQFVYVPERIANVVVA
jgi:leucyl-tRNA synthetase